LTSEVSTGLETSIGQRVIQSGPHHHILQVSGTPEGCHRRVLENIHYLCFTIQSGYVFSQNTIKTLEDGMVGGDQWNPNVIGSFSVLEKRLSVLLYHLNKCDLHFVRIVSSVCKLVFEDISWLLEASRGKADAADAGDQTFRYTF
jgi:hypothetical protein